MQSTSNDTSIDTSNDMLQGAPQFRRSEEHSSTSTSRRGSSAAGRLVQATDGATLAEVMACSLPQAHCHGKPSQATKKAAPAGPAERARAVPKYRGPRKTVPREKRQGAKQLLPVEPLRMPQMRCHSKKMPTSWQQCKANNVTCFRMLANGPWQREQIALHKKKNRVWRA